MYNYVKVDAAHLEYVTVAEVGELGDGERLIVDIADEQIAVFNIAGLYYAIAAVCSHNEGTAAEGEVDEYEIACPRHGAKFDIRNGRVLTLPAIVDIPAYPVRIEGDEIQIGLPIES